MAVKWYLRTSVTHGCDTMTLKYNHLERRKHTFYFRYRVLSWVRHIFEKECIRYSLNTNDYNIAIHLVKRESFKYDILFSKNVKESIFFNIFSEKPENTIVLKMAKMPQI